MPSIIRTIRLPARGASASAARFIVERDDFMENPPKKFFRLSPGQRGAAALRLFHHLPRGGEERGRRGGRAALHLRSGDARRQRARRAQGEGDPALGLGGGCPSRRKCGSTIRSSRRPIPAPAATSSPISIRNSLEVLTDARLEPALAGDNSDAPVQFERQGYFVRDAGLRAGQAGVQPHDRPARHVCEDGWQRGRLTLTQDQYSCARPPAASGPRRAAPR